MAQSGESRIVGAVCGIVGVTYVVGASLTFLLTPMAQGVGLTTDQAALALAIPSIGSLLIVFFVGRAGDSRGQRSVIWVSSIPFILGSLLVASAINAPMVVGGLVLAGASATAIQIASLGLLQASVPEGPARIAAFTSFGMVLPAVYVVVPVLSGWSVGVVSWRFVPAAWMVLGLAMPVLALVLLPRPTATTRVGEVATPLLAGLVLAATVQFIDRGNDQGWTSPVTIGAGLVGVGAGVVLVVLSRSLPDATFQLSILSNRRLRLLLVVVGLVVMVNTLTYVTLAMEFIFGMSALAAAIALIPAQVTSVVGAKVVAALLMTRLGVVMAGRICLTGLSVALAILAVTFSVGSLWSLVVSSALLTLFGMAAITIVNATVMAQATQGEAGRISATRGAASALGAALGVVVLGAVISTTIGWTSQASQTQGGDVASLAVGMRTFGVAGAILGLIAVLVFSAAMRDRTGSRLRESPGRRTPA